MGILKVFLFGKFGAQYDPGTLLRLETQKAQELFCYLLLYRRRPHSRETLADLLWDDVQTTRSKRYLSKALWQLQDALAAQLKPPDTCLLLVDPNWIQLNPKAQLWLDIASFEDAFALVQGVRGQQLAPQQIQAVREAADLYCGDLLEGWYQDWCIYERERLQHMYLAMLDKLIDHCEAHLDYETGIDYGALVLRYDRARERTHRRLMRLHYLAGSRTAALRQYLRCAAALREELDVRPTASTVLLYEQIRDDRLGSGETLAPDTGQEESPSLLFQVCDRLKTFHSALISMQHQVQQDIKIVERILGQDP
jgi:DNA-binding SARP family transcriptional activator